LMLIQKVAPKHNKLPKFAAKSAAGTNTYVDSPLSTTKILISQRNKCVLMYEL
jgi:hypothetical protein